ncbi:MAG: hypothetical protein ACRENC_01670 [Gemmatimonadaceae bacterium]
MKRFVFLALLIAASGSVLPAASTAQETDHPLAAFATRHVVVLPVHFLGMGDSLGWAAQIPDTRAYLDEVDAEIHFALSNVGVKDVWVFPKALVAMSRRNPGYLPNPYELAAQWLRPPMKKKVPPQLPEPFGSQIRSLVAMEDEGQYVLFPVEIRFAPAGSGMERAVVRVVLLDARRSRVRWMVDVQGDPASAFSPALAASVAEHLADLVGDR